jgi:hypothetical protein
VLQNDIFGTRTTGQCSSQLSNLASRFAALQKRTLSSECSDGTVQKIDGIVLPEARLDAPPHDAYVAEVDGTSGQLGVWWVLVMTKQLQNGCVPRRHRVHHDFSARSSHKTLQMYW